MVHLYMRPFYAGVTLSAKIIFYLQSKVRYPYKLVLSHILLLIFFMPNVKFVILQKFLLYNCLLIYLLALYHLSILSALFHEGTR